MRACDYRVYKCSYMTTYHERVSTYGGMDSELTGKKITEERTYFVLAPTMDLAIAAFKRYHSKDELQLTELICTLNEMITCP